MPKSKYSSHALDRIASILEQFTEQRPGMTFTELQKALSLNKGTLYRLLEVLRHHGWISYDENTGIYQIGLSLFRIGNLAVEPFDVARLASPVLTRLVAKAEETAHLCMLSGSDVVHVVGMESRRMLHIPSFIGRRSPAYATGAGKAILAFLPESELDRHLPERLTPLTPNTLSRRASLSADLAATRARGYSVDMEEIETGIRCVGAPVLDRMGKVTAGISLSGPASRMDEQTIAMLAPHVLEAAAEMSALLGQRTSETETRPAAPAARTAKGAPPHALAAGRGAPAAGSEAKGGSRSLEKKSAAGAPPPADEAGFARAVARAMYERDRVAREFHIEIEDAGPGMARASMLVQPSMSNSYGTCHGGMIFTLADTAFAYACNSANQLTVASGCDIQFVAPAQPGQRLVAIATRRALGGKSGVYDVEITDEGGRLVALFRGRSYRLAGSMVAEIS